MIKYIFVVFLTLLYVLLAFLSAASLLKDTNLANWPNEALIFFCMFSGLAFLIAVLCVSEE